MKQRSDSEFVDDILSRLEPVEVSPRLARRIAAIPIEHPREQEWTWSRLWQPALVLGLSAAMGIISGAWSTSSDDGMVQQDASVQQASSSPAPLDDVWLDAWDLAWGTSAEEAWSVETLEPAEDTNNELTDEAMP